MENNAIYHLHVIDIEHLPVPHQDAVICGLAAALGVEERSVKNNTSLKYPEDCRIELLIEGAVVEEALSLLERWGTRLDLSMLGPAVCRCDYRVEVIRKLHINAERARGLLRDLRRDSVRVVEGD